MRLPRNAKIFRGQLDAAPLASVLFLLLIFLVLNSKLVFNSGVRVNLDLPQAPGRLSGTTNLTVTVAIDHAGQIYYDSQAETVESLVPQLRSLIEQSPGPLSLEIQADKSSKLDTAFRLMAAVSEIGFKEALLTARPPTAPVLPPLAPP